MCSGEKRFNEGKKGEKRMKKILLLTCVPFGLLLSSGISQDDLVLHNECDEVLQVWAEF